MAELLYVAMPRVSLRLHPHNSSGELLYGRAVKATLGRPFLQSRTGLENGLNIIIGLDSS